MKKTLTSLLFAVAAGGALAQAPAPATPLISSDKAAVTVEDFEANLLRIPPNVRREARATLERVATITDNIYILRRAAQDAKAAGVLDDPLVRQRGQQVLEAYQAAVYLEHYENSLKYPHLEARAKEIYTADTKAYRSPETYVFEHILVSLWGRTKEMALARLQEARGKMTGSRSFMDLVPEYTDDPSVKGNNGRIGPVTGTQIDAALVEVLAKIKPGEISAPIQTKSGYHLVRLVSREPSRRLAFEEVKAGIMDQERSRLVKKAVDDKRQSYRTEAGVKVDAEALRALVREIPREEFERAEREAAQQKKQR